jgi:WhiB family transcriptional regulator, redox-sensing transcriptional regulator
VTDLAAAVAAVLARHPEGLTAQAVRGRLAALVTPAPSLADVFIVLDRLRVTGVATAEQAAGCVRVWKATGASGACDGWVRQPEPWRSERSISGTGSGAGVSSRNRSGSVSTSAPLMLPLLPARPGWHDLANCRGLDVDLFFPERGEDTSPAKAVCQGCAVRAECAADALATPMSEDLGIRGGLSARERRRIRYPRTVDAAAAQRKAAS